eukprot:PLAT2652.1.p1 GENE.PLAT2652.1~~PLAT2652.1.p1  ORF type:complete len:336 (+),score=82.92 PLAT2652.1:25-1008(+)
MELLCARLSLDDLHDSHVERVQMMALRWFFNRYDVNNDHTIDKEELRSLVWELTEDDDRLTAEELDSMLTELDTDKDERIDFDEFASWFIPSHRDSFSPAATGADVEAARDTAASTPMWDVADESELLQAVATEADRVEAARRVSELELTVVRPKGESKAGTQWAAHMAALCSRNDADGVRAALSSCSDEEEREFGTALLVAARYGATECAELLLAAGASVDEQGIAGNGVVLMAVRGGSAALLRLVVRFGADVNATALDGETALIAAVLAGKPQLCRILLDAGAHVHCRLLLTDESALDVAHSSGDKDIITMVALASKPCAAWAKL